MTISLKDSLDTHFLYRSADNAKIASGSNDRSVLLWDVTSGEILRRYTAHWEVGEEVER